VTAINTYTRRHERLYQGLEKFLAEAKRSIRIEKSSQASHWWCMFLKASELRRGSLPMLRVFR
jgi:hypothetical protein